MQRVETELLEFKMSFSEWKAIIQTLCGFANKNGGTVIVGFNDNGEPTNLQIGRRTIEDFVNKLKQSTDPVLYPSFNVKTFALGEIVEITIPKSDYKPVFAFGRAYTRMGKNTVLLSVNETRSLIKKYTQADFDKQTMDVKIEDVIFDERLIKRLNEEYYNFKTDITAIEFLDELELISNNKLTNAGYLCFVKENAVYTNAVVKVARFKGNRPIHFIDMKDIDDNLINAVKEALDFIKRQINMEVVFDGSPQRKEVWDYPLDAIREAVVNAIVHRNYDDSGNVQIRIFDDSLEIWSPGYLPKEIDIDNLKETNRSIPKNKEIANIFHKIELIESWGTGLLRIVDLCENYGLQTPKFKMHQGAFVVTFYKKRVTDKFFVEDAISNESRLEYGDYGKNKSDMVTDTVIDVVTDVVTDLSKNQKKILSLIRKNNRISTREMAELVAISQRKIKENIAKLKQKGVLERKGNNKTGYWKILYPPK